MQRVAQAGQQLCVLQVVKAAAPQRALDKVEPGVGEVGVPAVLCRFGDGKYK